MTRLKNAVTGVIVDVRDDHPITTDSAWGPVDGKKAAERSETPDKSWKVDELKAYATENGIDLGEATKKDDILAAINASDHGSDDDSDEESEES